MPTKKANIFSRVFRTEIGTTRDLIWALVHNKKRQSLQHRHYIKQQLKQRLNKKVGTTCPLCGSRPELKFGLYGAVYVCSNHQVCNFRQDLNA